MSYKTSLYNGVKSFLYDSTKDVQWATGVMYGAGAGAAYGLGSGVVSDNTSVFGGSVGGATFGAAAGAGLAYSTNKSAAIRGALRDMTNSAFGVNKAIRNMADEDKNALEAAKAKAMTNPAYSSMSGADKEAYVYGLADPNTLNMFKISDAATNNRNITLSNGLSVHGMDAMHAYTAHGFNTSRKNGLSDADILKNSIAKSGGEDAFKARGEAVPNSIDDILSKFDRYK